MYSKFLVILCVLYAAFLWSSAASALPEPLGHPDCYQNCTRFYGEVIGVFKGFHLPDSLFVFNSATQKTARFEIYNAHEIGSDQISKGMWVVVEGVTAVTDRCQVGGINEILPTFIYRWSGTYWEVYDSASATWIPW